VTRPLIFPRDSCELTDMGMSNVANTKTIAQVMCANAPNLDLI
jgi:hypothetical protein